MMRKRTWPVDSLWNEADIANVLTESGRGNHVKSENRADRTKEKESTDSVKK